MWWFLMTFACEPTDLCKSAVWPTMRIWNPPTCEQKGAILPQRQASSVKPQASSVKRQASSVKRQASKHHATHWSSRARSWMSLQLVVVEGYYTIKYGISSEAYPLSYKNQVMRADTPSRSLTSGFLVMATRHNSPSGRRTYNVEPYWSKRYVVDLILRRELMQVSKHNKRR
jgi:hypothetical protein